MKNLIEKLQSTKKVIWDVMCRIEEDSISKNEILLELDRECQLINDELGYELQKQLKTTQQWKQKQ